MRVRVIWAFLSSLSFLINFPSRLKYRPKGPLRPKQPTNHQIVGISVGTYCAPLVANLFLYCYEKDFMVSLSV